MLQAAAAGSASNTELTQLASGRASRPPAGLRKTGRSPKGLRVSGEERESVRQADRPVIEMEHGITVYPPEADGESWRAVFMENGARRFRQGATEAKLAEKLEKVRNVSRLRLPTWSGRSRTGSGQSDGLQFSSRRSAVGVWPRCCRTARHRCA